MNFRPIFLAAAGALVAVAAATPALAHWDRGYHRGYGGPRYERPYYEGHWNRGYRGYVQPYAYVQPFYARPVYTPPAYYYRAPPPVYYGPRW